MPAVRLGGGMRPAGRRRVAVGDEAGTSVGEGRAALGIRDYWEESRGVTEDGEGNAPSLGTAGEASVGGGVGLLCMTERQVEGKNLGSHFCSPNRSIYVVRREICWANKIRSDR